MNDSNDAADSILVDYNPYLRLKLSELLQQMPSDEVSLLDFITAVLHKLKFDFVTPVKRLEILEKINPLLDGYAIEQRHAQVRQASTIVDKLSAGSVLDATQFEIAKIYASLFNGEQAFSGHQDDLGARTLAMHRVAHHLTQLQIWYSQMYCVIPDNVWSLLHRTYQLAESNNIETIPLSLDTTVDFTRLTLEQRYKRCLLMAIANTSRMQFQEINTLLGLFEEWSSFVMITRPANRADLFSFDLTRDQGPSYQSFTQRESADTGASIDLSHLIPLLEKAHAAAQQSPTGEFVSNGIAVDESLLKRLILTWTTKPTRQFTRIPETGSVRICTTLFAEPSQEEQACEVWDMINTSPDGYCLMKQRDFPLGLEAGMLVRLQESSENRLQWPVGIIRWIRVEDDNVVQIGTQLLAPRANLVEIGQAEHWRPALLLPKVLGIGQPATLLIPTIVGKVGDIVEVSNSASEYTVKLTKRFELNADYSQFQFEILS